MSIDSTTKDKATIMQQDHENKDDDADFEDRLNHNQPAIANLSFSPSTSDNPAKTDKGEPHGEPHCFVEPEPKEMTVTDIIGDLSLYQWSLISITFIRFICVAMMTNTGPLIAPDLDYDCLLPKSLANLTTDSFVRSQLRNGCQIKLPADYLNLYHLNQLSPSVRIVNGSYNCLHWSYNTSQTGRTMTDEFDLVCDRDWLRSLFQSTVSVGVVLASVFWGTFSDKHGRCYSMRICFLVSLVSGSISIVAPNFMIYILSRSVCSLGDLGLVVSLATTLVESVGNKFRGAACIFVYLGWAIGVMIMPWVTDYFKDFRTLMLCTVVCHLITLPWLLLKKESVRWLLINKKFSEAHREVKRISRFNGHRSRLAQEEIDRKFLLLKSRFDFDDDDDDDRHIILSDNSSMRGSVCLAAPDSVIIGLAGDKNATNQVDPRQHINEQQRKIENQQQQDKITIIDENIEDGDYGNYLKTTGNNQLERISNSLGQQQNCHHHGGLSNVGGDTDDGDSTSLFAGFGKLRQLFESKELSTTTLTLIWVIFNSELLYMSFILINSDVGGDLYLNYAMGGLMETLAALISAVMISNVTRRLSLTSSLLCISCICFVLAFVHQDEVLAVWLLSAAKLAISTLSSLIYVTAIEMFPTDLRQTGSGACATFGSMGAVVAPFICTQLVNLIGRKYVFTLFSVSSATAALSIPFFLRETKGIELADTLDEIEQKPLSKR